LIARLVESAVRQEFGVVNGASDSEAMKVVRGAVRRGLKGHEERLAGVVEGAVGRVVDQVASGLVVNKDVSSGRAAEILAALEESGLLVRPGRLEELVEVRAQERVKALREEHGIPA
jgi:hypothetical protein